MDNPTITEFFACGHDAAFINRMSLDYPDLVAGDYSDCRLIIYATEYPNGVVASGNIRIIVYPEC